MGKRGWGFLKARSCPQPRYKLAASAGHMHAQIQARLRGAPFLQGRQKVKGARSALARRALPAAALYFLAAAVIGGGCRAGLFRGPPFSSASLRSKNQRHCPWFLQVEKAAAGRPTPTRCLDLSRHRAGVGVSRPGAAREAPPWRGRTARTFFPCGRERQPGPTLH